jgi:EAL domain-containing protein (putative c-di-GMP-specific phosphodiesterase class I)
MERVTAPTATQWRELIGRAVNGAGVHMVFQPVADVREGRIAGYEALVRFDLAEGLGPREWFAAAAHLGLAEELDASVLARVLEARHSLPAGSFLTVNIEPESLLTGRVQHLLLGQGSLAGLVVEVTGHRPIGAFGEIRPVFERLMAAGARLAVDDAGAGYEGVRQVLALRPTYMKIDRSLIGGIDGDEARTAMVEMLGVFAARAGASLWAEGVETIGEAIRLAELFVPLAQGYAFGRPAEAWPEIDPVAATAVRDVLGPRVSLDEPGARLDDDLDGDRVPAFA